MAEQPTTNEKPFSDECHEADPDMQAPVPAYVFTGRVFKSEHDKPYDAPK